MATRRYTRNLLQDGTMIITSDVTTNSGLTFQFRITNGMRPSLSVFTVASSSFNFMLYELSHFLNRANGIINGDSVTDDFEDNTVF